MALSTIPNSGGPGSSSQLSAVTIAVRDKVIEKFADQPLDEMNESVKQLLHKEEDEQSVLEFLQLVSTSCACALPKLLTLTASVLLAQSHRNPEMSSLSPKRKKLILKPHQVNGSVCRYLRIVR